METQASVPAAAPLHAPATWPTALRSGMDWGPYLPVVSSLWGQGWSSKSSAPRWA